MTSWLKLVGERLSASDRELLEEKEKAEGESLTFAISKGLVAASEVLEALSEYHDLPALDLDGYEPSPETVGLLSQEEARKSELLPLFRIKDELYVGVTSPDNLAAQDYLAQSSGLVVEPILVLKPQLHQAITRSYTTEAQSANFIQNITDSAKAEVDNKDTEEVGFSVDTQAPASRLLTHILTQGVRLGASDIHIEPYEGKADLRYRVDGVLHHFPAPPTEMISALTSRLKIVSGMDIAEKRLPQDGRSSVVVDAINYDLRVSIMPNVHGEGAVIRIMDPTAMNKGLSDLGFPPDMLKTYEKIINRPWGILLVTGPTGSGKSTTLYATLNQMLSPEKKIITLEDPVEFKMYGITQIPVRPAIGYSFAQGLRSVLRHDPDIVMVGEIRDQESAEIAIKAALTGHFLLSTLHTNSSTQTISRLLDMGLVPYQIQAALCGVLAQRLTRRLCSNCSEATSLTEAQASSIGLTEVPATADIRKPMGCHQCNDLGYKGRMAVYELLVFSPSMKKLPPDQLTPERLEELAQEDGFTTLRESVTARLLDGTTSIQEVVRLTSEN
jgi:type IV pilus assembly protein PilB